MKQLDHARRDLQDNLRDRASKKRLQALAEGRKKRALALAEAKKQKKPA